MGRFARSWALAKASLDVLKSDKELLVFPLVSGVALVLVAASFLLPAFGLGLFGRAAGDHGVPPAFVAWLFAFYLAQYFVMFFFNAALVGAAMIRAWMAAIPPCATACASPGASGCRSSATRRSPPPSACCCARSRNAPASSGASSPA